jgi:hypothetical protein
LILGNPPGDLGLGALDGLAGWALQAPPHRLEDAPHMPGMVRHPRHPLDHLGDARQRPQVVVEPGRHRPALQHPADLAQLGGAELGRFALAGGAHPRRTAVAPAGMPAAGGLRRHAQLTGDLGAGLPWANRSAACSRRRSNHCRSPGCLSTRPLGVTAARLMPGSITQAITNYREAL